MAMYRSKVLFGESAVLQPGNLHGKENYERDISKPSCQYE